VQKVEKLWKRSEKAAQTKTSKVVKEQVMDLLDRQLEITACPHSILLCSDLG
jgi:hypothetical protein